MTDPGEPRDPSTQGEGTSSGQEPARVRNLDVEDVANVEAIIEDGVDAAPLVQKKAASGLEAIPGAYYPSEVLTPRKVKKGHEDLEGMDLFKYSLKSYHRIVKYLKPYKLLFIMGLLFGVGYGAVNGLMVLAVKHVTGSIFAEEDSALESEVAAAYVPPAADTAAPAPETEAATTAPPPTEGEAVAAAESSSEEPAEEEDPVSGKEQLILERAASGVGGTNFQPGVLWACLMVPGIMLLRNFCGFMNTYLMLTVGMRVLQDIRSQVFAHIMSMSLDFFDQAKTGELIQLVYGRTRMIQNAAVMLASDVVRQPMAIIAALAALFYVDWKFTLGVFLLFPLCLLPVLTLGRMVKKKGKEEEKQAGLLTVRMQEAFVGIKTIKAFNREEQEVEKVNDANEKTLKNMMRWMRAMEAVGPIVEVVASLGVGLALLYAYFLDHSVEKFLALNIGLVLLYAPFKTLSRMHIMLQKVLSATDEIFEVLDSAPSIADAPDAKPLQVTKGEVRFEDVTFSFRPGSPAVRNIDLTFESGKYYALVGPTGAGKTTLFNLLMRLYDPQEGAITFDGQDIRKITQKSLREQIGVVSQQNFLFNDTIFENIAYGKIGATQEEVEWAAKQAHAHEFIMEKELGYQDEVGDGGRRLSGGQQQRICIARTFLKDAPILLLDEATASLDAETEEKIKEALDELSKGRTVISIAHRFSSLLRADEIIVLKNGEVKERGTHEELYASGNHYKKLYDLQFRRPGLDANGAETDEDRARRLEKERTEANLGEFEERLEAVGFE